MVQALRQPERGGAFYATVALSLCKAGEDFVTPAAADRTIQRIVAKESTITTHRMAAIQAMVERCASLGPGEWETLLRESIKLGEDGADPLLAMANRRFETHVYSREHAEVIEAIYTSGQAALMSQQAVPAGFVMGMDPRTSMPVYRYNGQVVTDEREQQALAAAAAMSVCSEQDVCRFDLDLVDLCWREGTCYDSREEYVRRQLLAGDAATYARAVALAAEMRAAIARGDRALFR